MSAFLYGRFESKREGSTKGGSTTVKPPALKTYADALVALVPSEALAAAAVFVASFTETKTGSDGKNTVTVTDHSSLKWAFYGCIVLVFILYIAGHIKVGREKNRWDRWDFVRMLIPPAAFVGWTMAVQPTTMFDAAVNVSDGKKVLLVVFGAILLGLAAALLGLKADQKDETKK